MRYHACLYSSEILLIFILVFVGDHAVSAAWKNETREIPVTDSVRIRAVPGVSTLAYGTGSAVDPAGLRSVDYQFKTQQPYEWFLKFNLQSLAGKHAESAILQVTKCAASSSCSDSCQAAGKCSCPTMQFIVDPSCGGGNINEVYNAGSDDLHAWHVPNDWSSQWKFENWSHTWNRETRQGVEKCCSQGSGGTSKLGFATYMSGVQKVGQTGTANLNVLSATGSLDANAGGQRYLIQGGYLSIRLTVNGTNSRFFVPEGGDFLFTPRLRIGLTWNEGGGASGQAAGTILTTTTSAATSPSTTAAGTGGTTAVTQVATQSSTSLPATTSITLAASTPTTSLPATQSASTASPTAEGTATTTPALATSSTGQVTTSTANIGNGGGKGSALRLHISQSFVLQLSRSADAVSAVTRTSFHVSCQTSAAYSLGKAVTAVKNMSVSLADGRRLQTGSSQASSSHPRFSIRYFVEAKDMAELHSLVKTAQSALFSREFGKHLILNEQALIQGLPISWFSFSHATTSSTVRMDLLTNTTNRTALGGVIDIYSNPEWGRSKLQPWQELASKAIQAAAASRLALLVPSVAVGDLLVAVTPGPIVLSDTHANVQFDIFVQIPPLQDFRADPDGKVYRHRCQKFSASIAAFSTSDEFADLFRMEIKKLGAPELPSMSFVPGVYTPVQGSNAASTASGETIAIILVVVFSLLAAMGLLFHCQRRHDIFRKCFPHGKASRTSDSSSLKTFSGRPTLDASALESGMVEAFDDIQLLCECGHDSVPNAPFCQKCGRRADLKTTSLGGALQEFDKPRSPLGLNGDFFNMLGHSVLDMQKQARELSAAAKAARQRVKGESPNKRKHKFFTDETGEDGKPLHAEANTLRLAMGGEMRKRGKQDTKNRTIGLGEDCLSPGAVAPTPLSPSSLSTVALSPLAGTLETFDSGPILHNAVDADTLVATQQEASSLRIAMGGPNTTPMRSRRSPAHNASSVGRAQDDVSSDSDSLEIVDVGDHSSEDERRGYS